MAADVATLGMKVESGDVVKATASLEGMTVAGAKTEAATQRLTRRMALQEIEARRMDAAMTEASRSTLRLSSGAAALTDALKVLAGAMVVRQAISLADAYTGLHAQLALVTTGSENLSRVQAELYGVAQETRTGLEATTALYASLARSTKSLGLSQSEMLAISKAVTESFAISGASTASTEAAVRQLGQAFASGVLRGDEFNSIAENAPRLQQAVAASLGVTTGELRAMAAEGKITSAVLATALLKAAKDIQAEFDRMPITVAGAMTKVRNAILIAVGATNEATGATAGLTSGLSALADAIPAIGKTVNDFFLDFELFAVDAGIAVEKLIMKMGNLQNGLGQALMGNGATRGLGAWLIKGAATMQGGPGYDAALETYRTQEYRRITGADVRTTPGALNAGGKAAPAVVTAKQLEDQRKAQEALQKAEDDYYNRQNQHRIDAVKALATSRAENDEMRAMISATGEGQAAVDALTIAQAGNRAEREASADLSPRLVAGLRQEAEQHARLTIEMRKQNEERARRKAEGDDMVRQAAADVAASLKAQQEQKKYRDDMRKEWVRGIEAITTQGLRSFAAFFDNVLGLFRRLMARMEREGKDSGLGYNALKIAQSAIGGGIAGYQTGQSIFSSSHGDFGNYARGAFGGAASGAIAGAVIGGPIGAAVGALAGLTSGILGVGSASKEAARQMADAQKQVALSMDALRASVRGDSIAEQTAAINADRAARKKAIEDAYAGGSAGSDRVRQRNQLLNEVDALENQRIANLQREAAVLKEAAAEDLRVRQLRNEGRAHEADVLAKQLADQRELDAARKARMGDAYLSQLMYNQQLEEAAVAAGKAADAVKTLNAGLNMVEGYKDAFTSLSFALRAPGNPGGFTQLPSDLRPSIPTPSAPMNGGQAQPLVLRIENVMNLDGREIARNTKEHFKADARHGGDFDDTTWGQN